VDGRYDDAALPAGATAEDPEQDEEEGLPPRNARPELRRGPAGEPEPDGKGDAAEVETGHRAQHPPLPPNPDQTVPPPSEPADFVLFSHAFLFRENKQSGW
jgi:hypothetical protein